MANTKASAFGPLPAARPGTAGRRAYGSIEPEMSQAARASGGRGAGVGVRAGSGGPPSEGSRAASAACRCAHRGGPSRSGGSPQRGRELQPGHEPVELGELVRPRGLEALRLSTPRRWPAPSGHLELQAGSLVLVAVLGGAGPAVRRPCGGEARSLRVVACEARAHPRSSCAHPSRRPRRTPHRRPWTCAEIGHEHGRAVQYSRRRRDRPTSASARRSAGARGDGHAGVVQAPAQRPRAAAGRGRSSPTPKWSPAARAARGRPRGSPPGPRCTSAPTRACGRRPRRRVLDAEQAQRRQPVDRLGEARRFLHVAVPHARATRWRPGPRGSPTRPWTRRRRSRPRAAGVG